MSTQSQLVACARFIAVYQSYPVLVNGLQPVEDYEVDGQQKLGLRSKCERERIEFDEASDFWHKMHESCDLLYYSACITEQAGDDSYAQTLRGLANLLHLPPAMLETAALAKYQWRAAAPGNKDESHEIRLIAEALGNPVQERGKHEQQ
jgi:hypothetical protein